MPCSSFGVIFCQWVAGQRGDDGLSTYSRCLLRRRIVAGEVESDSGLTDSEDEDEELVSK